MGNSSLVRKENIWVVDDNEAIVFSLTSLLTRFGHFSTGYTNPTAVTLALEMQSPDLLISDINMPEISGIELAMQVTDRCPNCKVLLCSARLDTYELVTDMARHGYQFAAAMKPLHPDELKTKIESLMETTQWSGHPQPCSPFQPGESAWLRSR